MRIMDTEPLTFPKSETPIIQPEELITLDRLPLLPLEAVPEDVCIDVLGAAAEVGNEQIERIITFDATHPSEVIDDISLPKSFEEMLDTSTGNYFQRAAKAWIKPRNPEGTIKLMKALQIDDFQGLAIKINQLMKKALHVDRRTQTNYTLGDNTLNSMVDFATNRTGLNEAIHMGALALNAAIIIPGVATGHIDAGVAVNLGAMAVNTYCILAQRYARARLSMGIDRALHRNKHFDPEKYTNALGIRVPESSNNPQE